MEATIGWLSIRTSTFPNPLSAAIEAARARAIDERSEARATTDLERRFDKVATVLNNLDIDPAWECAEETERRVLVEELVEWVTVFPDHLDVTVVGAPALNVLYCEVGLMGSDCWCRRPDATEVSPSIGD